MSLEENKKIKTREIIWLLLFELFIFFDDVISAVDNFFDQQDPSMATAIEEVCEL